MQPERVEEGYQATCFLGVARYLHSSADKLEQEQTILNQKGWKALPKRVKAP
jgi:hypothetical protein